MRSNVDIPEALKEITDDKVARCRAALGDASPHPFDHPQVNTSLKRVFACSDFVAKTCTQRPDVLIQLIRQQALFNALPQNAYHRNIAQGIEPIYALIDSGAMSRVLPMLQQVLRQTRHQAMVRIAWRDIAGWAGLEETMTDLSHLAQACLNHATDILHAMHVKKFGQPCDRQDRPQRLVVLGMGKLGARELNFSSDVDLIFAFADNGATKGAQKSITNEEFFSRLSRDLIQAVGANTADGLAFRVDMNLRPYGDSGPLVLSFDAMEQYYQLQGREWERYAWIKARGVAGDPVAGRMIIEHLQPFVYRRYLDYGVFEALRDMKEKIAREVSRKGMAADIKLGPGGIREVEFFGQMFQLLRGGVLPSLQERRLLAVLARLEAHQLVPAKVRRELETAYIFLRNVEHRLQQVADLQTHRLPKTNAGQARLAFAMGFDTWESFFAALDHHRQTVQGHFEQLLEGAKQSHRDRHANPLQNDLASVWHQQVENEIAEQILSQAGYIRTGRALSLLGDLRDDAATQALSAEGRGRLDRLMPLIIETIGQCSQPQTTLTRVVDMIKVIERRTSYLALLLEHPTAIEHLVKLVEASPMVASYISRHPVLLDELLDPRSLYKPPDRQAMLGDISALLQSLPADDLEYQIEQMCVFKQINILRVAAADISGELPLMRTSDYLTDIAEILVDQVVQLSWDYLTNRHGRPGCEMGQTPLETGFAVIAYGKFGGIELGYGSDLDLVFLHTGVPGLTQSDTRPLDNGQFYARLGQRIIHILTTHSPAGTLYEIDMRLRPSGSSGVLVSHVDGFEAYQKETAWTWEHQALLRARAICGDPPLMERFENIRQHILSRPRDKTELRKQVADMRERLRAERLKETDDQFDIKMDPGGIVDIEFLVQYLVLRYAHKHPELTEWSDNVRQLQTLIETGIIDELTAYVLRETYLTYRLAAHRLSLQDKPSRLPGDRFTRQRAKIIALWEQYLS
jgi:glutamate-ammonia-ligase adenylyltransferase